MLGIDVVTPGNPAGVNEMSNVVVGEAVNAQVAFTMMANAGANAGSLANQGFAAAADRRTAAADQLASDSQRMWAVAMTSPTVMAAHGMRVANEAGSGRTRTETNRPTATGAGD